MPIITLLTDFGNSDEYVGVMKGVILSINPDVHIIDLTHQIDPQDITQAAFFLKVSYSYFPKNTIHVVVVDPGVGTERKIVLLKIDGHFFIAPNNGILSLLWQNQSMETALWINNSRYFLDKISSTFHGRDIMAPVAAWVSRKISINQLGPPLQHSDLKIIKILTPKISPEYSITGKVIWIDRFGNLLTNIEENTIYQLCQNYPDKVPVAKVGNLLIDGISSSYQNVPEKKALIIIGSRGYLEISVNCGNASQILKVHKGDPVIVTLEAPNHIF
jgi:S-adenosyl-L-methionine hydrolase (adenosine-forming)